MAGHHYGGPTWENKSGSSDVQAVVMQRGTPDSNAVPWLLLRATNVASHGMFARTACIQLRVVPEGDKLAKIVPIPNDEK